VTGRFGPLASLLCAACLTGFGFEVVTPPPAHPDPPTPKRLEREAAPELIPTDAPGVFHAPSADEHLYWVESDELWYRRWRGRWYQAYSWNGFWFPPENVPEEVRKQAVKKPPPP
jgi:hypothetical protein